MLKYVEKTAEHVAPRIAKPQRRIDRKALRKQINEQHSKTFEYLAQ